MAQKSNYRGLLQELCSKKARFNILDVYICKNELIATRYLKDESGNFHQAEEFSDTKIKHFLMSLIEERCPKLREFHPHKILCVAYLKNSIRALTTTSILEIPEPRIYSLKFRSLHILPPRASSVSFFRVIYNNKIGKEFCCFKNLFSQCSVTDVSAKVKALAVSLSEFIYKSTGSIVRRMNFDMIIDSEGASHLVRTHRVHLSVLPKAMNTKPTNILTAIFNPGLRKRNATTVTVNKKKFAKRQMCKSQFVKMMAKTIDKERSKQKETSFGMLSEIKNMNSIEDLLEGMTATQPRNWNKQSLNMSKISIASESVRPTTMNKISRYLHDAKLRRLNFPAKSFIV